MKKIGIVTDSHSSISGKEGERLGIKILPMPFYIDNKCYYEDVDISRNEFFKKLAEGADVSTSQPSPESVMSIWDEALEEYEQILYLPISSALSGSCMTAQALAREDKYADKVYVVDNGRASTPLHRSVLDAIELIDEGYSAEEIQKILYEARDKMVIYIGVDTLDYLKKGGRVKPSVALIGNILNIKPVLKFDVGTLDMFQKTRGTSKMKKVMLDAVKQDLETTFKEWYDKKEVYLLAASSAGVDEAEKWVNEIREAFPGMEVLYDDLSLGICCHTGPGGLGIGISCKPKRS